MYMTCKKCSKLTDHEDRGFGQIKGDTKLGKIYECKDCGAERGLSKDRLDQIRAGREAQKEEDLKQAQQHEQRFPHMTDDRVEQLRELLNTNRSTPNVIETR